jgi:glycosyltransferase involved in cell wall biosynthesis
MKPPQPTVTIGIPAYNAGMTLETALDSALSQTFDHGFEIVIVDDQSSDLTYAIALEYEFRFPRVVRCFRQEHAGVATARNRVLQEARGAYITWLDADDRYRPFKLTFSFSQLYQAIKTQEHRNIIAYGDYTFNGKIHNARAMLDDPMPNLLTGQLNGYLWTTLAPIEIYRNLGGFRAELHRSEDQDLLVRFLRSGGVFHHVSGPPQIDYTFQTTGRSGTDVEESFRFMLEEYRAEYEQLPEYKRYIARRLWEVSGFYQTEKKWEDMWRCRGEALGACFEEVFPRLMAAISVEINNKIDAAEKRIMAAKK